MSDANQMPSKTPGDNRQSSHMTQASNRTQLSNSICQTKQPPNPEDVKPPSNDNNGNHNGNNKQSSNPKDLNQPPNDTTETEAHLVINGNENNHIDPSFNEKKQKLFLQLVSNGFSIIEIQTMLSNYVDNSDTVLMVHNIWSKSTIRRKLSYCRTKPIDKQ
eukprot:509913_1